MFFHSELLPCSSPGAALCLVSTKNHDLSIGPVRLWFWMALSKHNRLRPEPIRFVKLDSEHAQRDGKSVSVGHGQRSWFLVLTKRSRDGAVVRALASQQCGLSSIPGPGVICGLSLLLVLYTALRDFSLGTLVFPSPQKPTFPNFNSILECTGISIKFLWTPGAPWVNKLNLQLHF